MSMKLVLIKDYGFVLLVACIGSFFVHMRSFKAMETVPLSAYASLNAIKPVMITAANVFFFGESMTTIQVLSGGVIILSSLYFLNVKIPMKRNIP